eukprot:TRINITY_DN2197_c1_g2_i1.p3 TRINITY_DN2197_c1_g2~~TRINITY_DN2197_c1_g2_i1.p3  ORF type:complete len:104 (-),score=3.90 TRINITY_DN2197_c1_g2_i1:287-598(-)
MTRRAQADTNMEESLGLWPTPDCNEMVTESCSREGKPNTTKEATPNRKTGPKVYKGVMSIQIHPQTRPAATSIGAWWPGHGANGSVGKEKTGEDMSARTTRFN